MLKNPFEVRFFEHQISAMTRLSNEEILVGTFEGKVGQVNIATGYTVCYSIKDYLEQIIDITIFETTSKLEGQNTPVPPLDKYIFLQGKSGHHCRLSLPLSDSSVSQAVFVKTSWVSLSPALALPPFLFSPEGTLHMESLKSLPADDSFRENNLVFKGSTNHIYFMNESYSKAGFNRGCSGQSRPPNRRADP